MDATTINPQLPARRMAEAIARAFDRGVALPAAALRGDAAPGTIAAVEVFKKTPCAAGLSRDVAQHMPEVDGIAFLSTTLLDRDGRVPAGAIAETSNGVMWKPCQDVQRSADNSVALDGDVVGFGGIQDVAHAGFNRTLTDKEWAMRPSETDARATNHRSTVLCENARQWGRRAAGGVMTVGQGLREAM